MRVFVDIVTDDELLTDAFNFELLYNDAIMKYQGKQIKLAAEGEIDIGCGNEFGGAPEEEGGEEEAPRIVTDVIENAKLVLTKFEKKEFKEYIKKYFKRILAYLQEKKKEDRIDKFKAGAQEFIKHVMESYDKVEFYLGPNADEKEKDELEGGVVIAIWEDEEAPAPVFYFFADGLKEVKY